MTHILPSLSPSNLLMDLLVSKPFYAVDALLALCFRHKKRDFTILEHKPLLPMLAQCSGVVPIKIYFV